jgi:hypothetical protein
MMPQIFDLIVIGGAPENQAIKVAVGRPLHGG